MLNLSQASNGLANRICNFQILLGEPDALRLNGDMLEINTEKLQSSNTLEPKELLLTFNYLNKFGAEFPSSVLIHVTNQQSKTHLSNGHDQITSDNVIVHFDLVKNKFS